MYIAQVGGGNVSLDTSLFSHVCEEWRCLFVWVCAAVWIAPVLCSGLFFFISVIWRTQESTLSHHAPRSHNSPLPHADTARPSIVGSVDRRSYKLELNGDRWQHLASVCCLNVQFIVHECVLSIRNVKRGLGRLCYVCHHLPRAIPGVNHYELKHFYTFDLRKSAAVWVSSAACDACGCVVRICLPMTNIFQFSVDVKSSLWFKWNKAILMTSFLEGY